MQQEFAISGNNYKYWTRFKTISFFWIILLAFGLIMFFRNGISQLNYFLAPLYIFWTVYFFLLPRRALSRIIFNKETRQVRLEILVFNKVKSSHTIPFDAFRAVMLKDPRTRNRLWVLKLYAKKKLIFKQKEHNGWSADELFAIEKAANLLIQ